jgi:HEAT repeat protein
MVGIFGMGRSQGRLHTSAKNDPTEDDIKNLLSTVKNGSESAQDSATHKLQGIANKQISPDLQKIMVKYLIEALKDEKPLVRSVAAETLGVLVISKSGVSKDLMSQMVDPLISASEDTDYDARDSAVYALGCLLNSDISAADNSKIVKQLGSIVLKETNRIVQDRAGGSLQEFINYSDNISDLTSMRDNLNSIKNDANSGGTSYPGLKALDSFIKELDKKINFLGLNK